MNLDRILIRNVEAPELIELFLIASIASVLAIRAFLAATGYPQIGGDGLHVAHMLWGGLFMMLALLMSYSLMGIVIQRMSAILAGVGFGTFIDELGKFITGDNNYFFQPTIGLIYIIFIGIFLLIRVLRQNRRLTPHESLANILNRLVGVIDGRIDAESRRRVNELLSDTDDSDALVETIRAYTEGLLPSEGSDMRFYFRLRDRLVREYSRVALNRFFAIGLTALLVLISVLQTIGAVALLVVALAFDTVTEEATFVSQAQFVSSTVAALMILYGAWRLRRSRVEGYRWYLRAVLLNIFITYVFAFFESELAAVTGLSFNILFYLALRFLIERETSLSGSDTDAGATASDPSTVEATNPV